LLRSSSRFIAARKVNSRDIDFVRSDEEDGNAISDDLKNLEAKISKGNITKGAAEDLVPGAQVRGSEERSGSVSGDIEEKRQILHTLAPPFKTLPSLIVAISSLILPISALRFVVTIAPRRQLREKFS